MLPLSANNTNPFKQGSAVWVVELSVPFSVVEIFSEYLGNFASSVSCFEEQVSIYFESQPTDIWKIQLYYENKPDQETIASQISLVAASIKLPVPTFSLTLLPDNDWVSRVQENFPPLSVGRYFVHGSHYTDAIPFGSYRLQIDAGRAFGTGEHETTSSCLQAIDELAKQRRFTRMLDMGCGSGILALAMAKTWKKPVVAVDIDEQAVKITQENARINQLSSLIIAGASDGYNSRLVTQNMPYELIVSNILAKPLVAFAPDLARNLAPNGVAILSGLLKYQERKVLSAHLQQGLRLVKRIEKNSWSTLVVAK